MNTMSEGTSPQPIPLGQSLLEQIQTKINKRQLRYEKFLASMQPYRLWRLADRCLKVIIKESPKLVD